MESLEHKITTEVLKFIEGMGDDWIASLSDEEKVDLTNQVAELIRPLVQGAQ